jgi:hypothetical protein
MRTPGNERGSGGTSLRLRISLWNAGVVTVTLALFTTAAIVEERRQILRTETGSAEALLGHLAEMPELRSDLAAARRHLGTLNRSLQGVGGGLELAPAGAAEDPPKSDSEPAGQWLARQPVSLAEGDFELRYRGDPTRLAGMTRHAIAIHSLHGLLAIGALIAGTEMILRRGLLAPLRSITHQLDRMRDGGGWLARVPATDTELAGLARAVAGLGPGLESQAREWIEAERRGAAMLALRGVRARLSGPEGRVRTLLEELSCEPPRGPAERGVILEALVANLRAIHASVDAEERAVLAGHATAEG